MAESPERCSFEFDPEAWEREHEGTCFVDPDDDEEILTENADGDMVWRCPHEAAEGEAECMFHLPRDSAGKPDAETLADAFLDIANGERETLEGDDLRPARFIGTELESLNLDAERVGNGRTIDLRHVDIKSVRWDVLGLDAELLDARGSIVREQWDCSSVDFAGDVWFDGADFVGDSWFRECEFKREVRFYDTRFDEAAWFVGTEFDASVEFSEATFGSGVWFRRVDFAGDTRFEATDFDGPVWFENVGFDDVCFTRSRCSAETGFNNTDFHGTSSFNGVESLGPVGFDETRFDGPAEFMWAEFGGTADFKRTEFGSTVRFDGVQFGGEARFAGSAFADGATFTAEGWYPISPFQDDADFSDVTAGGRLRFVDEYETGIVGRPHTFLGEADFENAEISGSEFSGVSFRDNPTFEDADLTQADLSESSFREATFEGTDLTRADLSDASVAGANFNEALLSLASLYGTDLTNARLYGVRMESARVSDHTDFGVRNQAGTTRLSAIPFRGPWPGVRYDERNPEYEQFEESGEDSAGEDAEEGEAISDHTRAAAVYAEIERVAEANADSELARRCYLWRKDMQRKRYRSDEGRGNSPAWVQYCWSWILNITIRYAESPWRVTGIASLVILGCALLYYFFDLIEYSTSPSQSALLAAVGGTAPDTVVTFLDAVYFSTLTFSTLGMGTFQPSGPVGRAVAIFETLSGVVLLALLVFVFGRRATR